MNHRRNFLIRFTTKKNQHFGRYFRKCISVKHLYRYIGENNALNAVGTIENFKGDKLTLKYRKFGRLEI